MSWSIERVPSPIGLLTYVANGPTLVALEFEGNDARLRACLARRGVGLDALAGAPGPSDVAQRLGAYFEGDLAALDAIPVAEHGTAFERRVYEELRKIPRGTVITYTDLARLAGRAGAVRAAGATNAKNPISIVVPCHRVIGANGTLTGYAGGLARKRWLLAHEGVHVNVSASEAGSRPDRSPRGEARSAACGEARCSA